MKNLKFTILFLLTSFFLQSQTSNQIIQITKGYDNKKIKSLANKFEESFNKNKEYALKMAKRYNWPIIINNDNSYLELMKVVNGEPLYYTTFNANAAISTRTNTLHNNGLLGLNIEGQNMTARVWDGGLARTTHQEYDGIGGLNRYSVGDNSGSLHFHAAHVTGTIMASGFSPAAKGMAPQSHVIGYDWNNDMSEMAYASSNGMLLSNHSYGFVTTIEAGRYNEDARNLDLLLFNAPYYLAVYSAGNNGLDNSFNTQPLEGNGQFDKLMGDKCSKNSLIIANANDANIDANGNLIDVNINVTSSQGPTDDLRIKPDLTGNGTELYSTGDTADNMYLSLSGTSMASPNVTGTLLLLQQYYNELNNQFMKSSTLKGLVLHTADDAGYVGPDSKFGWGLLNAKNAAEVIRKDFNTYESQIHELSLSSGQSYVTTITSDGVSKLIASISWTDPAGNINNSINSSTPALINDLDIRITKNGTTYFPFKLTSVNTNTTADNNVDPFERIDIENATGDYTITISHKGSLVNSVQNYTLVISGLIESITCNAIEPNNIEASVIIFGSSILSWNNVPSADYEIRYREVSSSLWTTLTTSNETINLVGLTGGEYVAQIRSVCSDESIYSNWVTFENPPNFVLNGLDFVFEEYVNVYSNDDYLFIESSNNYNISKFEIFNLLGKRIYSMAISSNKMKINKFNFNNENILIIGIELSNGRKGYKKIVIN